MATDACSCGCCASLVHSITVTTLPLFHKEQMLAAWSYVQKLAVMHAKRRRPPTQLFHNTFAMEDSAIVAITRKLVNAYQVPRLDMIVSYLTYPWSHTC